MKQYVVTNLEFVNSYDAYSNTLFIGNGNVLIPYINLGLMPDNPINGEQTVIDFSYYLLEDVSVMSFAASRANFSITVSHQSAAVSEEYISFGLADGAEVKVLCSGMQLFIPKSSIIRTYHEPFVPINTGSQRLEYRQNIDTQKATSFFVGQEHPEEIKQVLGSSVPMLTWTGDGVSIGFLGNA